MSQPPAKLQKWVARQKGDLTDQGPIVKLALHHAVEGGEGLEFIDKFEKIADISALDLAQMIWDSACQDAEAYQNGMPQRYKVLAYRVESEDSDGMPETTFPFLIQSPKPLEGAGGTTEPPNERGMTGQFMRHLEQNQRMFAGTLERMFERVNQDHERERTRRIEAEKRAEELAEAREALLDRKQERELEAARARQQAVYIDQLLSGVLALAPLIIAKFLGNDTPAPPGAAARLGHSPSTLETFNQLIGSLTQADAMKVLAVLPDAKKGLLMEIYTAAINKSSAPPGSAARVGQDQATLEAFHQFLKGLTYEEVMKVVGILSETQQRLFLDVYKAASKTESKRQEEKPPALKEKSNGEQKEKGNEEE